MILPPLTPAARLRWDAVERHLADLRSDPRILELGAGSGAAGARLALLGDYVGVEPDELSNRIARSRLPQGTRMFDAIDDVEDHDFDVLCSFEVLEHIDDDLGELRRWIPHVKPAAWSWFRFRHTGIVSLPRTKVLVIFAVTTLPIS